MADAVLVTPSFLPGNGGIETHLAQLCAELAPRIAVLAPAQRDGKKLPSELPYPVMGLDGHLALPSPAVVKAIAAACRQQGTRKVLLGTPWPLLYLGPRLVAEGLRYAVMVHGAEVIAPATIPGSSGVTAAALARADLILPVSHNTAHKVRTLLEEHQRHSPAIAPLPPRIDLERFNPGISTGTVRQRFEIPDEAPMVLSFGRLVARKGAHRAITAMREVRKRIPTAVLVIAGTGPQEKRLRRLAADDEGVIFAGRVPDQDAPRLYATADVFVLPVADRWGGLEFEGLGVVLLEAAATATPTVVGRSGGTTEAVIDYETGFVIDGRSPEQLEHKITWLLEHPVDATRMGVCGFAHVAREFSGNNLPSALLDWLSRS